MPVTPKEVYQMTNNMVQNKIAEAEQLKLFLAGYQQLLVDNEQMSKRIAEFEKHIEKPVAE